MRERAIRLLEEVRAQHPSDRAAIQAIASKIGCNPETLRAWYRKHQDAQNPAAVAQQAQDARIKALERENYGWCPKMYAASNKSVVDIEKSDGKCLNVIEHLLGKTAGFTHRTAYPLA